jgi:hypothetical protein
VGSQADEGTFGHLPFGDESVFEIAVTSNRHNLQVPDAASRELRDLIVGMPSAVWVILSRFTGFFFEAFSRADSE